MDRHCTCIDSWFLCPTFEFVLYMYTYIFCLSLFFKKMVVPSSNRVSSELVPSSSKEKIVVVTLHDCRQLVRFECWKGWLMVGQAAEIVGHRLRQAALAWCFFFLGWLFTPKTSAFFGAKWVLTFVDVIVTKTGSTFLPQKFWRIKKGELLLMYMYFVQL